MASVPLGPPAVGFVVDATGSYAPAIAALVLLGLAAYAALLPLGRHVTARNSNHNDHPHLASRRRE